MVGLLFCYKLSIQGIHVHKIQAATDLEFVGVYLWFVADKQPQSVIVTASLSVMNML